eukprot:c44487_g1_i1 orf=3-233(-)
MADRSTTITCRPPRRVSLPPTPPLPPRIHLSYLGAVQLCSREICDLVGRKCKQDPPKSPLPPPPTNPIPPLRLPLSI